jgi:hypothetical protein
MENEINEGRRQAVLDKHSGELEKKIKSTPVTAEERAEADRRYGESHPKGRKLQGSDADVGEKQLRKEHLDHVHREATTKQHEAGLEDEIKQAQQAPHTKEEHMAALNKAAQSMSMEESGQWKTLQGIVEKHHEGKNLKLSFNPAVLGLTPETLLLAGNPYHDEHGRFTSGEGSEGSEGHKMAHPDDVGERLKAGSPGGYGGKHAPDNAAAEGEAAGRKENRDQEITQRGYMAGNHYMPGTKNAGFGLSDEAEWTHGGTTSGHSKGDEVYINPSKGSKYTTGKILTEEPTWKGILHEVQHEDGSRAVYRESNLATKKKAGGGNPAAEGETAGRKENRDQYRSKNEGYGFHGAIYDHSEGETSNESAHQKFIDAAQEIAKKHDLTPEQARDFLDSREGRHIGDQMKGSQDTIHQAMENYFGGKTPEQRVKRVNKRMGEIRGEGKGEDNAAGRKEDRDQYRSNNEGYGYHGAIYNHDEGETANESAHQKFIDAAKEISDKHGLTPEQARDFLDSRDGRHIGDQHASGGSIHDAMKKYYDPSERKGVGEKRVAEAMKKIKAGANPQRKFGHDYEFSLSHNAPDNPLLADAERRTLKLSSSNPLLADAERRAKR